MRHDYRSDHTRLTVLSEFLPVAVTWKAGSVYRKGTAMLAGSVGGDFELETPFGRIDADV